MLEVIGGSDDTSFFSVEVVPKDKNVAANSLSGIAIDTPVSIEEIAGRWSGEDRTVIGSYSDGRSFHLMLDAVTAQEAAAEVEVRDKSPWAQAGEQRQASPSQRAQHIVNDMFRPVTAQGAAALHEALRYNPQHEQYETLIRRLQNPAARQELCEQLATSLVNIFSVYPNAHIVMIATVPSGNIFVGAGLTDEQWHTTSAIVALLKKDGFHGQWAHTLERPDEIRLQRSNVPWSRCSYARFGDTIFDFGRGVIGSAAQKEADIYSASLRLILSQTGALGA